MRERPESSNLPEQHDAHNIPSKSYEGTAQEIQRIHRVENQVQYQNFYNLQRLLASLNSSVMPGDDTSGIVAAAESFKGTPYVWGWQGQGGIDCSGLVVEAMKKAGTPIPDMTAADMLAKTPEISPLEAKPGDLVLAKNWKHVEIFTWMQWGKVATIGSASSRGWVSEGTLPLGSYTIHRNTLWQNSGSVPENMA